MRGGRSRTSLIEEPGLDGRVKTDPMMPVLASMVKDSPTELKSLADLFSETFVETSSGDIGLQVRNGPLFRTHSHILSRVPGFLEQVRALKPMPLYVDRGGRMSIRDWMIKKRMPRALEDVKFQSFTEDRYIQPEHVPYENGYSTAHEQFNKIGALQRRDHLRLAEKYEIIEQGDRVVELLRYVYLGRVDYLWMEPHGAEAKKQLMENMIAMLFCAAKFALDDLFYVLMKWFPLKCRQVCGDDNFTESFYKIEYYLRNQVQEPLFQRDMLNALLQMGCRREYLMLISWDSRWNSLESNFLHTFLDQDQLAILNEGEILLMVERWNANRDKQTHEVLEVLHAFRQSAANLDSMIQFLFATSILKEEAASKTVRDPKKREARLHKQVFSMVAPNNKPLRRYKPMSKKQEKELQAALAAEQEKKAVQEKAKEKEEDPDADLDQFLQVRKMDDDSFVVKKALSFTLHPIDSLLQKRSICMPGNYRIRLAFTQKHVGLWDRSHEVYIGILYGGNKFFGYLCGASPFIGIYDIRNVSGVCQRPEQSCFLTGSGNKMELDLDVTIGMQLCNGIHTVKCAILANNSTIASDDVQWTNETMAQGVRIQIVPVGFQTRDEIDCRITWVSNGTQGLKGDEDA
ncbi:unnamed protein product [Amoebophrya sp. A25]|nr:unnamed protein product [Amoebophrya sp. A25]|eukprot:GSA25T00002277001.1